MNPKLTPIAVIVAGLLLGAVAAVIVETWVIPSTGTIAIAAYLSPFLNAEAVVNGTDAIDWGTFAPGETSSIGLTVTNISPQPVTVYITFNSSNPLPAYLTLNWTNGGIPLNNTVFATGESQAGTLNLTASASATLGPFDFDIWIRADPDA